MRYYVTYNCVNENLSSMLCREIYKSDAEAITTVLNKSRERNKTRENKDNRIVSVNIYRLVKRNGSGYFKTIVYKLEV